MPYTRNTRIKIVTHKHKTEYIAQVEYRYLATKKTWWEDINNVEPNLLQLFFCHREGYPLPWRAFNDCCHNTHLDDVEGLNWAKAVIDQYHKLFDEKEYKPSVEYIKYPD